MANRLIENLWRWSDSGHLPIVVDASSCTYGILHDVLTQLTPQNAERHRTLAIYDSVAWAYNHLLPRLQVQRKVQRAVIHPTCSTEHLGLNKTLLALAAALADEAVTPTAATCCGFAGDRGFLHPELTQAATFEEANEVRQQVYDAYLSSNRTLELAVEMGVAHRLKARLLMQPWLILAGCWTLPNRSLVKTAKVVRAWVERIARALACRERLTQTLRATVAAMHRVGRQAYRRKQPATWQLLGGTFAGLA